MAAYTDATPIYVLMAQKDKRARGFSDGKRAFTFAFTTKDQAEAFLKEARAVGMLLDVDLLYAMTVGEYFQWQKEGKTAAELTIDPDAGLLQHPQFKALRHANN